MEKIDRSYIRYIRYAAQGYILLFLTYAGYRFYLFADHFAGNRLADTFITTTTVLSSRPALVEGFLPIGALMSLKLWLLTGIFDNIHPAGLVIFIAALLMALLLRKSFCGWICPVGALSDWLWRLRMKIFSNQFVMNRWIDYSLRSIKYFLMTLFVYIIVIKMSSGAILGFIEGDYYKIADVKMLYFFTRMSATTMTSLGVLFLLSVVYRNFWCRYLCPYGGLLGLLGVLSPLKITRNEQACIHCHRCTDNCPSLLPVEQKPRVVSPECTGCLTCVSHCPAKGALNISFSAKKRLNPAVFVLLLAVIFFGSLGIGKLAGKWDSSVTYGDYQRLIPHAVSLEHP